MKTIFAAYEELGRLITEEKVYKNPEINFSALCLRLGVDEQELDRFLQEELGYGGEEYLAQCRKAK